MNKTLLLLISAALWASPGAAQELPHATLPEGAETPFEAHLHAGYRWMKITGRSHAGEYEYLHPSAAGSFFLEWDPLPHRLMMESYYLNRKDFFTDIDYAYHDLFMVNVKSRGLFHNLDHYSFGPDPNTPPVLSFTDRNPGDRYGVATMMNRAFVRFKTPDFPFHIYADTVRQDKEGTVQQRFLLGYFGALEKVSTSRTIDWQTCEVTVGANSHLGLVEVDYSHAEKKFEASGDKILYDAYPNAPSSRPADTYPHNLVPDLKSSSDTVKVHTSHTGRITAAATYSQGDKKNEDSGARSEYWNAAGDLTFVPARDLAVFFKYRHYDLDVRNPDTITLTGTTSGTINAYSNVRDSISSQKDVMTSAVRYRLTDRLTLRGEYAFESVQRDIDSNWDVAHRTTKNKGRLAASYRVLNRLTLRGDVSYQDVDHPAYNGDPDAAGEAKVSMTWLPVRTVTVLLSYGGAREHRADMEWDGTAGLVIGGQRKTARDQALGSVTMMIDDRSSVTATYAYFHNNVDYTVPYHDGSGNVVLDPGLVPYDDAAHTGSIAFTRALSDQVTAEAEASRTWSRGSFRPSGSVPGSDGIAGFSDLKVVENVFSAGIEMQHSKAVGTALRYQYREYNDQVNSANDGTLHAALATVSVKW
jgi:hypothetical protein